MPSATTIGGGITIRGATRNKRELGTFKLGAPPIARNHQTRPLGPVRSGHGATTSEGVGITAVTATTDLTED